MPPCTITEQKAINFKTNDAFYSDTLNHAVVVLTCWTVDCIIFFQNCHIKNSAWYVCQQLTTFTSDKLL